ncbi:MAG: phosphodiesterase [Clostridia bacterium]|nr:phosphodiesterase [Clostridia bacterium]
MKLMIASDIHGSAYYCRLLMERMEQLQPDRLLLLGDVLYHGPRNDLPREYAPKQVLAMLNERAGKILCVRGNCDAEVDQMVLDFSVLCESLMLQDGDKRIVAVHGHHLTDGGRPCVQEGDTVLFGHTHIPEDTLRDGVRYLNTGSVSIPKNGSPHSYMVYEDGEFRWFDLESGETYQP